jgi:hypothetical protein
VGAGDTIGSLSLESLAGQTETLKITVPAHRPVKRSTLAHILKQARLSVDDFGRFI